MTSRKILNLNFTCIKFPLFIILLLIVFLNLSSDVKCGLKEKFYKVNTLKLRVRKEPSINSKVIGSLPKDLLFRGSFLDDDSHKDKVDGIDGKWIFSPFFNGYIFTGYLEDVTNDYTQDEYEYPPNECSQDDDNNLKCENILQKNLNKPTTYLLKYVKKIFYYRYHCTVDSAKDLLIEYPSYNKIKKSGEASYPKCLIIIDKKTKQPIQITLVEGPPECEE